MVMATNTVTFGQAIRRGGFYDGEKLFKKYCSMGAAATYEKLFEFAKGQGMFDPDTGKPSNMGMHFAMWRWALRNPEEAWKYYEPYIREFEHILIPKGIKIDFNSFLLEIRDKTGPKGQTRKGAVGRRTYVAFCRKYNLTPED